jgi:hypothetical protein
VLEKTMNQGSSEMSRGRMNDQPWRLIHDNERGVLINNREFYRLRLQTVRESRRNPEVYVVRSLEPVTRFRWLVINLDAALFDQRLNPGSCQALNPGCEKGVYSLISLLAGDEK